MNRFVSAFAFFLMALFPLSSFALCFHGAAYIKLAAQIGEYSPEDVAKMRRFDGSRFLYVNPTLSAGKCFVALTIAEKVDQQAGRAYANLLAPQLVGYRNWRWAQALERSPLQRRVGTEPIGHYIAMMKHPWLILNSRTIAQVRAQAEQINGSRFDDEGDAIRHYFGAFLLTLKMGPRAATTMLDLHEKDVITMSSMMDRYNNAIAVKDAEDYYRAGVSVSNQGILQMAGAALLGGRLMHLNTSVGKPASELALAKFENWAHRKLRVRLN
jgi:hypothetical protein